MRSNADRMPPIPSVNTRPPRHCGHSAPVATGFCYASSLPPPAAASAVSSANTICPFSPEQERVTAQCLESEVRNLSRGRRIPSGGVLIAHLCPISSLFAPCQVLVDSSGSREMLAQKMRPRALAASRNAITSADLADPP